MTDTLSQVEPRPPESDHHLIAKLGQMYESAKSSRGQLTEEWKKHYRITMNRSSANVPTANGVRANEIFPAIDARIGWMTDQEISCAITPAANPFDIFWMVADVEADHLEAVINSIYYATHWYSEIVKMLWNSSMYGAGFLKVGWDAGLLPGKGPDGEPLGNVTCKSVSPWCLYVDPYATNLENASYICEVHTMTPEEIERRYPTVAYDTIEEAIESGNTTSDHIPPNNRSTLEKQGPQLIPVGAAGTAGQPTKGHSGYGNQGATTYGGPGGGKTHRYATNVGRNVYEMWWKENVKTTVKPTDPNRGDDSVPVVFSRWRVTVWSGNRVLVDTYADNLFETNWHPYVRYVDSETDEFYGSALLRDLAPCQIAMNRLLAMAQNNTEYTGNPVLIGIRGSGVERSTWLNRPGQIYDVNGGPNASQNRPDWLSPPNLPSALMDLIGLWRDEIERICGLQGPQRGEASAQRQSNSQQQNAQEAGLIRVRLAQRNLEIALSKVFERAAQLIIVNYDVSRTVAIVGPDGEQQALQLAARHFMNPGKNGSEPLRFSLMVNGGATKPTSRSARFAEAMQLKAVGAVDNQYVLEAARVSHIPQVLARVQQEQQMAAQAAKAAHSEKGQTHEK